MAAFLVIALCVVLHPLAAASPPDPSWVTGVYDAADFDDIVVRIGLLAAACDALAPPLVVLDSPVRDLVLPGELPPIGRIRPTLQGRAPPLP